MNVGRVALIAVLAVGMVVPAGAAMQPAVAQDTEGTSAVQAAGSAAGDAPAAAGVQVAAANNSSVNVTVGQQLSTVLTATETEVGADVEETTLEADLENGTDSEKAEALADRAEELRERAADVRETYRETTRAYERGELSRSAYAQQLAVLNSRARTIVASYERLTERTANVSGFELAAAGLNRTALREAVASLETATGPGASALLQRFTGQSEGEVEIERGDGLSIEVSSEDGERSREVERPRDGDAGTAVDQAAALATARAALSEQPGNWSLARSSVHPESGYYRFSFALRTNDTTGEAEVRIDGSTGEVFRLEEEIEPRDGDEEDGDEEDEEVDELTLLVADGTPAPGATVTVQARADGEPLTNATVLINGVEVGETGVDGTLAVTLENGSTTVVARAGDEDAALEFEFERDDESREREDLFGQIDAGATLEEDTISLSVTYNGSGVANVTVYADDGRVGETGADGTLTFTTNATEELDLELVKGELEAELEYRIVDGTLVLEEEASEGDGDKADTNDGESEDDDDQEADDDSEDEDTDGDDSDDDTDSPDDDSDDTTETPDDDSDDTTETPDDDSDDTTETPDDDSDDD